MPPIIRQAGPDEIEMCREIECRAGAVFRDTAHPGLADAEASAPAILRAAQADGLLWIATDDDISVGQLTAAEGPKGLLIVQIDVLPQYQRRGIGRALIARAEAEARARALPGLWLRTFRNIPWNAPFYAKLGFEIIDDIDETVIENESMLGLDISTRVTMRKAF